MLRGQSKTNTSANIPKYILDELQKYYYKIVSKNTVLYNCFTSIVAQCSANNIEVVALKGIFLADKIYEDIGIRQLSDIDLLVHEEDALKCAEILLKFGFEYDLRLVKSDFSYTIKDTKHLPMLIKNGIGVEIHSSIVVTDSSFSVPIADYWQHSQTTIISDIPVLVFEPNYLLLHICMHLDEHFVDSFIHFVAYIDIIWILEKYKTELDWQAFDEMCERYNCIANVYPHLYLCTVYLQASIPDFIVTKAQKNCSQYHKEYFVNKLQCNNDFKTIKKNRNISELKKVTGFGNKCRFLFDDMFPSKSFMNYRYKIKTPGAIYWYYVVRQFGGIVSVVKYLFRIKSA